MKIVCTENSEHKKFTAIAHITQEWVTDENGNFEEVAEDCIDVLHRPNSEDLWQCRICGVPAKVE